MSICTFSITLTAKSYFSGTLEASSREAAVEKACDLWRTANPNPFEQYDDELVDVVAEEVLP